MTHFIQYINIFNIAFLLVFYFTIIYTVRHQIFVVIFGTRDVRGLFAMDFPITPFDLFVICFVADFCFIHLVWKLHTETPGYTIYEATQHLTDVVNKYQIAYTKGDVFVPDPKQLTIIKDGFYNTAEITLICVVVAGVATYVTFYLSSGGK